MLKNPKRNLIYFIIITLISGWIGVLIDLILTDQPEGNSLGMGIWLVLPFLCGIVFRIREKEWKGFGLSLNIKEGWKGCVIAVFIYPAILIITLMLALCFGAVDIFTASLSGFLSAMAVSLSRTFLKNIFEEFAWRGYLTPGLIKYNLNDWLIYGISGLIWGLWHTAYYMVFLGDEYFLTSSRLGTLISGCLIMVIWSALFVEICRMTESVWPCVMLHSMEEAIPAVLVPTGVFVKYNSLGQTLFDPVTGIFSIIIIAGAVLFLRRKRMRCSH